MLFGWIKLIAPDIGAISLIAPQLRQKIARNKLNAPKVQTMEENR
jgi:hypothetical protein